MQQEILEILPHSCSSVKDLKLAGKGKEGSRDLSRLETRDVTSVQEHTSQ